MPEIWTNESSYFMSRIDCEVFGFFNFIVSKIVNLVEAENCFPMLFFQQLMILNVVGDWNITVISSKISLLVCKSVLRMMVDL